MKIIEKAMEDDEILFATLRGADAAIDRLEHETAKVCWKHLSGEMSMEEAAKEAFHPWGVHSIMLAKHWSFWPMNPRASDYARHDRYEAMVKDCEHWKAGEPFSEKPWLFTWEKDSSLCMVPYRMAECHEATDYEKVQFFRACEATVTPLCIFDSPSGIPVPSYWNANAEGKLHLELDVDGSPLLLEDDPIIGKEFRLPIAGGGEMCIKIMGVEPGWPLPYNDEDEEEDGESFDSLEWECEGHIEGYTSEKARKITFTTWDAEISLVTADVLENEDWTAHRNCELWKPFEKWVAEHGTQIDVGVVNLFEKACEMIALFGEGCIDETEDIF